MKKLLVGLLTFLIVINVHAREITLTVCEKENCNSKNIDDVLTKAEDYNSDDIINIVLKDDYKVYELESHDLNSTINIINRTDKKLDLIEIKGKNNCTITLKNTFSFTNSYNNDNGEVDLSNITFTTKEFRGDKNLVVLKGKFVLNNINVDGITKWEDYLRNSNNLDNFRYDDIYGITFKDSKIEADGLNVNNFIKGIVTENSHVSIKNSDLSSNVYSVYNNDGKLYLDFVKLNSLIIGKKDKTYLSIKGTSEFNNTIKFNNKEPSNYYEYKDYSNIILLNYSVYNIDLNVTKVVNIDSKGISLKRVFPTIDGVNSNGLKWKIEDEDIARVSDNMLIPTGVGNTKVSTQVNRNIKYTVHLVVNDKKKSFLKIIIGLVLIVFLGSIITRKDKHE